MSEGNLGEMRVSVDCQEYLWVSSAAFGNVLDMSGVIWECLGISEGVCGKFEGVQGLRGVSGSLLPSFAFNFRESQIRFSTFSSRPGGSSCLKYQNVIKLRLF